MIDSTVHSRRVNVTSDEEPLEFDQLAALGTDALGRGWLRQGDSVELRIDNRLRPVQLGDRLPSDQRLIHRLVRVPQGVGEGVDGRPTVVREHEESQWFRASVHRRGSFDKQLQADEKRAAALAAKKQPKPIAPVLAATPPALAAKPQQVVPLNVPTDTGNIEHDVSKDVLSPFVPRPLVLGGTDEIRGRTAVMGLIHGAGVKLGIVGDEFMVTAPGGVIPAHIRDLLERPGWNRLIKHWVRGDALPCCLCSTEAVRPGILGAPLCDTHAQGAQ